MTSHTSDKTPSLPLRFPLPGGLLTAAAAAACAAVTAGPARADTAAPTPAPQAVVLDKSAPLDAAAFGDAIAWLRSLRVRHGEVVKEGLVVRDGPGATPRLILGSLPGSTQGLAIGTDASGRLTVVVAVPHGLFSLPADGSRPMRPVAGTEAGDSAPGLRAGRLSFTRTDDDTRPTVRVGSLTSRHSRVLWVGQPGMGIADTAISTPRTVVFQTFHRRGTQSTQLDERVTGPHGHSRHLLRQTSSNGEGEAGTGRATVSADGQQVTVNRWDFGDGQPDDLTVFALPSGQRLRRTPNPGLPTEGAKLYDVLPLTAGGFAVVTDIDPFYLVAGA
jgi:hypothetical protein